MNIKKWFIACLVLLLHASQAYAASESSHHNLSVGIASLFKLAINESSLSMGSNLDPDNLISEYLGAIKVTVKNNDNSRTMYIQVQIDGDLTSASDINKTIPESNLKFKGGDILSYTSISSSLQTVKTYAAGSSKGVFEFELDYSLDIDWDLDAASDYSALITYALTDTP